MNILKALFWTILFIAGIGAIFTIGAILVPVAIVGIIFFFILVILEEEK